MARNRQRARDRKSGKAQEPEQSSEHLHRENVPDDWEHGSAYEDLAEAAIVAGAGGQPAPLDDGDDGGSEPPVRPVAEAGDDEPQGRAPAGPKPGGNRFINFLRASWAELQRVQWPDRRQVAQATAVVLGFVAIAGAYLGLADAVAQRIVDFII
jgi:preprotein translocase subunit SecE